MDLTPEQIVEETQGLIEAAKNVWNSEYDRARRANARKLLDLAGGDQIKYIRAKASEPAWHATGKPKFAPNVLGMALTQLSYLYDEPPQRTMENPASQEWAEDRLWGFDRGVDVKMAYADKVTRLCGLSLVQAVYKHRPEAATDHRRMLIADEAPEVDTENDGVSLVVHERDRFCIVSNELDEKIPEAVLIRMTQRQATGLHGYSETITRFHFWTAHVFAVLESKGGYAWETISVSPHALGELPFVVLRNSEGSTELEPTLESWGGCDLFENVRSINELWTEYMFAASLQRGQPWTKGKAKNLVLAPDAAVEVPLDGDFGIVANQANLTGIKESLEAALGTFAKSLGLPSRSLQIQDAAGQSGISIMLSRAELADDRRSREPMAKGWEFAYHDKAANLYEVQTGTAVDSLERVEFSEPAPVMTAHERRESVKFELEQGLMDRSQALRTLHPELSEDEIASRLAAVDAEAAPDPAI